MLLLQLPKVSGRKYTVPQLLIEMDLVTRTLRRLVTSLPSLPYVRRNHNCCSGTQPMDKSKWKGEVN